MSKIDETVARLQASLTNTVYTGDPKYGYEGSRLPTCFALSDLQELIDSWNAQSAELAAEREARLKAEAHLRDAEFVVQECVKAKRDAETWAATRRKELDDSTARAEKAERERDAYKEALKQYADLDNWSHTDEFVDTFDQWNFPGHGYELAKNTIQTGEENDTSNR